MLETEHLERIINVSRKSPGGIERPRLKLRDFRPPVVDMVGRRSFKPEVLKRQLTALKPGHFAFSIFVNEHRSRRKCSVLPSWASRPTIATFDNFYLARRSTNRRSGIALDDLASHTWPPIEGDSLVVFRMDGAW
jgi:hypothetical protein